MKGSFGKKVFCLSVMAAVSISWANRIDVAKYDPRMAEENVVISNNVKWVDGRFLPIEGRAFDDVDHYYDRLPSGVTKSVNEGVRNMKHHTSGMLFRFVTDSKKLDLHWVPYSESLAMNHMPATGVSGIDVYRFDRNLGRWLYLKTGRVKDAKSGGKLTVPWVPGEECIVNLPLYNGIKSFKLGIDPKARIIPPPPHRSGIEKPVVFYGTSITQGGCCSRPGLGFVNWVGRDLGVAVVGLGFSGSGIMEYEMSEHLARIDASCYVLDCLWNMKSKQDGENVRNNHRMVEVNYEPFIRNLRAKRPGVPIVMAEQCDVFMKPKNGKDVFIKSLYDKLIAEGWKDLYYLPKEKIYTGDHEGTVDAVHPNDLGMQSLKNAFGGVIRQALKIK